MALDYGKFKKALAQTESSDNPAAGHKKSSAKGLYQFIPRYWDDFAKKEIGMTVEETMPKDKSPEEMQRARADQNKLFKAYYEKEVKPNVERLAELDKEDKYSEDQLGLMVHFLGSGAAKQYVKTGKDPAATKPGNKWGNPTMEKYLSKWDKVYESAEPDPSAASGTPDEDAQTEADFMSGRGQFSRPDYSEATPVGPENQRPKSSLDFDKVRNILSGKEDVQADPTDIAIEDIATEKRREADTDTVTVKSGDTLGKLAKRYDTTVEELARENNIKDVNKIQAGAELRIPDMPAPKIKSKSVSEMFDRIRAKQSGKKEEPVEEPPPAEFDPYLGAEMTERMRRRLNLDESTDEIKPAKKPVQIHGSN